MDRIEIIIREMCADFGVRLIKSWDDDDDDAKIESFVANALANYFSGGATKPPPLDGLEEEKDDDEPKSKSKSRSRSKSKSKSKSKVKTTANAKNTPSSPSQLLNDEDVDEKPKVAKKKPKCQALTTKGTPCSKCALVNEPFCSVHIITKIKTKGVDATSPPQSPKKSVKKKTAKEEEEEQRLVCEAPYEPVEIPGYDEPESSDPDYSLEEEDFDELD